MKKRTLYFCKWAGVNKARARNRVCCKATLAIVAYRPNKSTVESVAEYLGLRDYDYDYHNCYTTTMLLHYYTTRHYCTTILLHYYTIAALHYYTTTDYELLTCKYHLTC